MEAVCCLYLFFAGCTQHQTGRLGYEVITMHANSSMRAGHIITVEYFRVCPICQVTDQPKPTL